MFSRRLATPKRAWLRRKVLASSATRQHRTFQLKTRTAALRTRQAKNTSTRYAKTTSTRHAKTSVTSSTRYAKTTSTTTSKLRATHGTKTASTRRNQHLHEGYNVCEKERTSA
jgi:hypothetical protein